MLAREKALAETIWRGLDDLAEIDLTLEPGIAREQLADCRYDAVVVGREGLGPEGLLLLEEVDASLPLVLVGGPPTRVGGDPLGVPVPVSFNLLRRALQRALAGVRGRQGGPERRAADG